MKKPALPLLKAFNLQIKFWATGIFALVLLFSWFLRSTDGMDFEIGLISFLALVGCATLHLERSVAGGWVFPVSAAEFFWTQLAVTGILWAAGFAAVLLAHLATVPVFRSSFVWFAEPRRLPLFLFLMLVILRFLGAGFNIGYSLSLFFLGSGILEQPAGKAFYQFFLRAWPLVIAGSAFLIWEAPAYSQSCIVQGNGRPRTPLRTVIANCLFRGLLALLLFPFFFQVLKSSSWRDLSLSGGKGYSGVVLWPCVLFLFLAWALHFPKTSYARMRASGFGKQESIRLAATQLTFIFAPVLPLLGVKSGAIIRCADCGQFMFLWQVQCPRCRKLDPLVLKQQNESRETDLPEDVSGESMTLYRYLIPGILVWRIFESWFG